MNNLLLLGIGLGAGVLAGMFGIGGGIVIVPALLYFAELDDRTALGTSLASLVPPVGLLAAYQYYRGGYVNLVYAGLIALGLFVGSYFGAKLMLGIPPSLAKRLYAIFLMVIAAKMLYTGK